MSPSTDVDVSVESLRAVGAERFDPVRFRFLEALSQRLPAHDGDVRRLLESRLAAALADYQQRFAQYTSSDNASPALPADNALKELLRSFAQQTPQPGEALTRSVATDGELKAVRLHRDTWSRLSIDKQMRQAMKGAPENAGPLNSHWLVLRALAQMREIAPTYLDHFMSHADTLLWLDQAEQSKPSAKKPAEGESSRKRKAVRSRQR